MLGRFLTVKVDGGELGDDHQEIASDAWDRDFVARNEKLSRFYLGTPRHAAWRLKRSGPFCRSGVIFDLG